MKATRPIFKTFLLSLLLLSLPLTSVLAGFNPSARFAASLAASADDPIPVLACEGVGSQPASVAEHGLRFTPGQDFASLELRLAASTPGVYQFNLEFRRSQNFSGPPDYTVFAEGNLPPQDAFPYRTVEVAFNTIPAAPTETLTVKVVPLSGAGGQIVFESFGQGNDFCTGAGLTDSLANPSLFDWGAPAGFKLYNQYTGQFSLPSKYTAAPPTLDGSLSAGEWNLSNKLSFQKGFISVMNDTLRLYVLIDVLSDYGNDPDDQFSLSFDVSHNGAITSLVDKNYALTPAQNMRYQYYTGPGSFTALQPETYSARARGFGCFNADLTASYTWPPSQNTYCNAHTLYELAFDLDEIGSEQGQDAYLGLTVSSSSPSFTIQFPQGYPNSFAKLIKIDLDPKNFQPGLPDPNPLPGLDRSVFSSGAEITQATQKTDNSVRLSAPFNFHVQLPAGALMPDLIRLKKANTILDTLSASSGLPSLSFTSPAGGETWSGQQTLQWTAADPNSDPLTYNLWYSPDLGVNWFPAAAGLTGSTYTVDLSTLPGGGSAIFKLIASDGFNTVTFNSPAIVVPNIPPRVQITVPPNGLSAPLGTQLELAGQAQDPEQETLTSSSYFWYLDGQPLGKGETLLANLPAGSHTLRLAVIDSQGAVGYDEISLSLTTRVYLPFVVR